MRHAAPARFAIAADIVSTMHSLLIITAFALAAQPDGSSGSKPAATAAAPPPVFVDATAPAGLADIESQLLCFADLNSDGRPDAILHTKQPGKPNRYRVFLNTPAPGTPLGFRFVELNKPTGLPTPRDNDCLVFADLRARGTPDAVFTRYLDINNPAFTEPDDPKRTCWLPGNGDGTFGPAIIIEEAKPATTSSIAVGDPHRAGFLALYLGNWYTKYGASNEAFTGDLIYVNRIDAAPAAKPDASPATPGLTPPPAAPRVPTLTFSRSRLPEDAAKFDEENDAAGRPTYGTMFVNLWQPADPDARPPVITGAWESHLLALSYGRRANRLWSRSGQQCATGLKPEDLWRDTAPGLGLDGDEIRHGQYPGWLKELGKTDKRFDREDEKLFRSHGNTFDAAIGDIDNDGDFDLFFAEITHAWAGESSDRSRFLVNQLAESLGQNSGKSNAFKFLPALSVDRIPPIPPPADWTKPPLGTPEKPWTPKWNQGDLYCELADLDNDGRLDLILASAEYPDPAPFDNRLRIFHQESGGTFKDVTSAWGIDHFGSQQFSLADVDGDGALDILVGQSYNRFPPADPRRNPAGPRVKLYHNQTAINRKAVGKAPNGVTLTLVGDGTRVNRDALGAIVRLTTTVAGKSITQSRQLIGIGGHAGKQHQFLIHFGLGEAAAADTITINWPGNVPETVLTNIAPGHHTITLPPAKP